MSENEKLKLLAGLVLNNWERLDQVIQIVNTIREQQMDAQFETEGNNLIRHAIDQVSACLETSVATREQLKKLFNS
jgi:ribosomal protein L16 Arg81 hydroxylase